jgi:hypothetical protein
MEGKRKKKEEIILRGEVSARVNLKQSVINNIMATDVRRKTGQNFPRNL